MDEEPVREAPQATGRVRQLVRYDPWQDADDREDLDWLLADDITSGDACWMPWWRLIVLRRSLHPIARRCVMAHELVHVDNDDVQLVSCGPDGPRQARRQEDRADREAARRLIDLPDLAAAMAAHPISPRSVAAELDVTTDVLQCRLDNLGVDERTWLAGELGRHDHAA